MAIKNEVYLEDTVDEAMVGKIGRAWSRPPDYGGGALTSIVPSLVAARLRLCGRRHPYHVDTWYLKSGCVNQVRDRTNTRDGGLS